MGICYLRGWSLDKAPGEKLARADVEHNGHTITRVQITGDFYIYPEEGLALLEQALVGAQATLQERELAEQLETAAAAHHLELVGLSTPSLARLVHAAIAKAVVSPV